MVTINLKDYSIYIIGIFFVIVAVISFFMLQPFITPLLTGLILAYIFYPVYRGVFRLFKKERYLRIISRKNLVAILVSVFVIIIILVPTIFLINSVTKELNVLYILGQQRIARGELFGMDCPETSYWCEKITSAPLFSQFRFYLNQNFERVGTFLIDRSSDFIFRSLTKHIINGLVIIFVMFFLFRDGQEFVNWIRSIVTLKERHEKPLIRQFEDMVHAVIYGNIIIAIVEGILMILGFLALDYLFGIVIPSPIFWGIITVILAMLPVIGASIVWGIAAIVVLAKGHTLAGLLLIFYGLFLISGIDIFLKPKIIGDKAKVHPILILLGVLGGISFFGFIGFIIGPILLGLFATFVKIYEHEKTLKTE